MARGEIQGVAPQNAGLPAPGVSLKQPERDFLDALTDLIAHVGEPGYPKTASGSAPEPSSPSLLSSTDPFTLTVPDNYHRTRRPSTLIELYALGEKAGLREVDVRYIREWVVFHGIHWLTCERAGIEDNIGGEVVFRNPVVRKILNAACEEGLCVGTMASKEELADFYTQRVRDANLPDSVRDNAADKLAKLLGYYPDSTAKGGGTANVQINLVNPYATPPVVDAEVVNATA